MAKARKIRKHVATVKNIRTITKTMEMIASARYRRAHDYAMASRPYTDRVTNLVAELQAHGGAALDHPLMVEPPDVRRDVQLVLTSNRGLCGGYNSAVLGVAEERYRQVRSEGYEIVMHVSGKRGAQHYRSVHRAVEAAYTEFEFMPAYDKIGRIAEGFMADFLAGRISGVEVAYMQYRSSSQQQAVISQILPLADIEPSPRVTPTPPSAADYEFMPSAKEILGNLLPVTVRLRLWQCFLDASASEQVMRVASMRAATDNADEMIRELTIKYNRTRQSQITSELAEIMGGRVTLE